MIHVLHITRVMETPFVKMSMVSIYLNYYVPRANPFNLHLVPTYSTCKFYVFDHPNHHTFRLSCSRIRECGHLREPGSDDTDGLHPLAAIPAELPDQSAVSHPHPGAPAAAAEAVHARAATGASRGGLRRLALPAGLAPLAHHLRPSLPRAALQVAGEPNHAHIPQ